MVSAPRLCRETGETVFSMGTNLKPSPEGFKSAVFLFDFGSGAVTRVTAGEANDRTPAISPDGKQIAYISDPPLRQGLGRQKASSLFVVNRGISTCPYRVDTKGEVAGFEWTGSRDILMTVTDTKEGEDAEKTGAHDEEIFEENPRFYSLWRLDTQSSTMVRITQGIQVWEFSASKDGSLIGVVYSELPYERSWYRAKLGLIEAGSKGVKQVFDPGFRQLGAPRMSPNGKHLLFTSSLWSDRNSQFGDLYLYTPATGKTENLTENSDYSVSWAEWADDETAYFVGNRLDESVFFEVRAPEWTPCEVKSVKLTLNPAYYPTFDLVPETAGYGFVFSAQYTGEPPELWLLDSEGSAQRLTGFNKSLAQELEMPSFTMIEWTNRNGEKITGYLEEYPVSDPAPLVVSVHGGPTSSVKPGYVNFATVLAAKGYTVFYPNFTGSTGRGRRFAEKNRGDMGGQDLEDVIDGVHAVMERRPVDTSRVYIMGGSYGGFMTMWALTQSDIFAAGASLYGVSDWVSFHGTSVLSDWDEIHYAESPYEFRLYDKFSPIRHVKKITSPLLLLHGREDPYVPLGQSLELFRALKDLGRKTRLVVYPREGHGFREKDHYVDAFTRVMGWFEENRKKA